jgi:hypothetical protein
MKIMSLEMNTGLLTNTQIQKMYSQPPNTFTCRAEFGHLYVDMLIANANTTAKKTCVIELRFEN